MSANRSQLAQKEIEYKQIIEYWKLHPEVSYRNIGKLFNRTGQRIHQILLLKGEIIKGVHKPHLTQVVDGNIIKVGQ
ncbi:hypothetical protein M0R04_13245 [Candidatus Dojkabacteria bacterium]|jgi:hypothetical protein|nr:hypothetical protein [Candidatus Dojkabacteria bacterium]